MPALTKGEIAKAIAESTGLPKSQSAHLVATLIELVKKALISGDDVLISGFGKFCVKAKRERRGRNPANGTAMTLRPRKVVTFHCSSKLRETINLD